VASGAERRVHDCLCGGWLQESQHLGNQYRNVPTKVAEFWDIHPARTDMREEK
jgi:hypothetical protein